MSSDATMTGVSRFWEYNPNGRWMSVFQSFFLILMLLAIQKLRI